MRALKNQQQVVIMQNIIHAAIFRSQIMCTCKSEPILSLFIMTLFIQSILPRREMSSLVQVWFHRQFWPILKSVGPVIVN
jgi:hypothetical protein